MRIVKLSSLSEKERKRALEEQEERYQRNQAERERLQTEANQKFNEYASKHGTYDTNKHAITYKDVLSAMQDRQQKSAFKKANGLTLWEQVKSIAGNAGRVGENTGLGAENGILNAGNYMYASAENARTRNDVFRRMQSQGNKVKYSNKLTDDEKMIYFSSNGKFTNDNINNVLRSNPLDDDIEKNEEKIQKNISKQSDAVSKKLAELAPSVGNMGVGMVASAVNPVAGATYFGLSSAGSYMNDAKQRGMSEDDAIKYGAIMGALEGATEMIGIGNIQKGGRALKTLAKGTGKEALKTATKETTKAGMKEALKGFGIGIADNFMQESIMEPLQELTAQSIAGKDKANWDNMGKRMLQSGIDGALTSIIMSGATAGANSCIGLVEKAQNGQTITQEEVQQAVKDAKKSGVDIQKVTQDSLLYEKDKIINENKQSVYKDYNTNKVLNNDTQNWLNKAEDIINENTANKDINQQTKTPQNPISQQQNIANNQKIQTNPFNGYTEQEINNIKSKKISIAGNNEDIINFAKNSRRFPGNFKMYLGKVRQNISDTIKSKLGINVDNYNISLKTDDVRKIIKDHGSEKTELPRGQLPITESDFANIPEIINNPDSVEISGESPQGKPAIKFEKNINGNNVVVTYVSDKHHNLEMQTMYKFKNDKKIDSSTALHENQTPGLNTSEMDSSTNLTNNSIPQNNENVNTVINNNMQNNEKNIPTKGENINWLEIEKPEDNKKIRKHYRSIIESSNTTAEAKSIAKELMGTDTYVPETNKGQLMQADARITNSTPEVELQSLLSKAMNGEKISPVDIAIGERLIQYYSKTGSKQQLQEAIQATALAGTSAGQTVQALSMLNHQTPQGQATWIQRSVDKMNKELAKKKGGTITTDADGNQVILNKQGKDITGQVSLFDLTPEMLDKIINSENQEQMYKNIDEVYEELGQQVPKGTVEKLDTWRYFSMLANIRTHARNMIGNFAMGKTQGIKDRIAGGIEDVVSKFNPEMERTKTLRLAEDKTIDFVKNDFKNADVQSRLELNENKYNPQSRLQNARRTFKSDAMENTLGRLFNLNDSLLEAEDGIGLKAGYQKALADYITANKIDVDNITDAQLNKARNYAIQQAKEATFHQANAIASAVTQFGNKNNITKFFTDAMLPFKKTPMNVAKAGMEYSPLQILKSATTDVVNLRKGNISINQYIDNLSKGLTGTGIAVIGCALARAGILKASGDDDQDKEKFDEEQGKQRYSIEIAGKTYSLDWLAPTGIPLFIGAEANKFFEIDNKEKTTEKTNDDSKLQKFLESFSNLANAGATAINPMSEMSMISGLTSALSSYNTQDNLGSLGNIMTNAGKSYVNQYVPTLLGQVAKTGDEFERSTKSTKTGTIGKAVDQTLNQMKSKIPGLRQTLPIKTNIWGENVKQEVNLPLRAFNNFINPATVKSVSTDQVDKELNKLYDVNNNSSILPEILQKTLSIDNQKYRLTNKEYADYTKKYGETSYKLINDLIKSKDYKTMSQEQKEEAISNIYSYAKESNKIDYASKVNAEVKESTLYKTLNDIKKSKGKESEYLTYLSKVKGLEKESQKNKVLANLNCSNKTKEIIYTNGTGKDDKLYNNLLSKSNIDISEYLDYKDKVSSKAFKADKNKKGKTITGSGKNKVVKYANENITGVGNRLMLVGSKYALKNNEKQLLINHVNRIANTKEEKLEIYKQLDKNFVVKNGKVYMKKSR